MKASSRDTPSEGSTGHGPAPPRRTPESHRRRQPAQNRADHTAPRRTHAQPLSTTCPHHGAARVLPPSPGYGRAAQPLNFFDWIRSHGIHRGRDRWIGGVSSGIAERMGIDPLIVRGIFIVLTLFAGIGVLLYGLAWALLPEPDGRIHVQEAGAGRWTSGMTGALITTSSASPAWAAASGAGATTASASSGPLFWIGGAIYLIYFLTQRNKTRNGAPMNATPAASRAGRLRSPAAAPLPAATGSASPLHRRPPAPAGSHHARPSPTRRRRLRAPPRPRRRIPVRPAAPLRRRPCRGAPAAAPVPAPRRHPSPGRRPGRAGRGHHRRTGAAGGRHAQSARRRQRD